MGIAVGIVLDNSNPGLLSLAVVVSHVRLKVSEVWVQIYETSVWLWGGMGRERPILSGKVQAVVWVLVSRMSQRQCL